MTQRLIWNPAYSGASRHLFDETTNTLRQDVTLPYNPQIVLAPHVELRDSSRLASLVTLTIPCLKATMAASDGGPVVHSLCVALDEIFDVQYLRLIACPFGERPAFMSARPHDLTSALAQMADLPLVRVRQRTTLMGEHEDHDDELWHGALAVAVIGASYGDARVNLARMLLEPLRPFFPSGVRVLPL